MRNLLLSFDEFKGRELISERDLQDYLGRYQDLRDEWVNRAKGEKEDITDDIVFEIELIRQIEINIDYILMLVKKYHDSPTAMTRRSSLPSRRRWTPAPNCGARNSSLRRLSPVSTTWMM